MYPPVCFNPVGTLERFRQFGSVFISNYGHFSDGCGDFFSNFRNRFLRAHSVDFDNLLCSEKLKVRIVWSSHFSKDPCEF